MQVQAITKYARMSPMKLRQVAREIQGARANEALELLRFIPRKSARLLAKTLKSAIANAEENEKVSSTALIISEVVIEEGPAFRRFRPASRGSAHPYKKRTSHIKITLTTKA